MGERRGGVAGAEAGVAVGAAGARWTAGVGDGDTGDGAGGFDAGSGEGEPGFAEGRLALGAPDAVAWAGGVRGGRKGAGTGALGPWDGGSWA